jgi:hypothetical protein
MTGLLGLGLTPNIYRKEVLERFSALFAHYQITPDRPSSWQELAIALALDHVEGFQLVDPPKKRGPRLRWSVEECRALLAAVKAQRHGRRTIKAAIKAAMKQPDWRWGNSIDSAETRHSEAKRRVAEHERLVASLERLPTLGMLGKPELWRRTGDSRKNDEIAVPATVTENTSPEKS